MKDNGKNLFQRLWLCFAMVCELSVSHKVNCHQRDGKSVLKSLHTSGTDIFRLHQNTYVAQRSSTESAGDDLAGYLSVMTGFFDVSKLILRGFADGDVTSLRDVLPAVRPRA